MHTPYPPPYHPAPPYQEHASPPPPPYQEHDVACDVEADGDEEHGYDEHGEGKGLDAQQGEHDELEGVQRDHEVVKDLQGEWGGGVEEGLGWTRQAW